MEEEGIRTASINLKFSLQIWRWEKKEENPI
jgi:hypothetical protein